jgi:hypothetical protein
MRGMDVAWYKFEALSVYMGMDKAAFQPRINRLVVELFVCSTPIIDSMISYIFRSVVGHGGMLATLGSWV